MSLTIRPLEDGEYSLCDGILRGLPDWFGIEESIVNYVQDLQTMETWICRSATEIAGFLTINQHNRYSAEIHVMAVSASHHGRGYGRRLVEHAEQVLRSRSVEFLEVKTLAPSRESKHYERTRGFYRRLGFKPLEENLLWGEANPCLVLVKHLSCTGDGTISILKSC